MPGKKKLAKAPPLPHSPANTCLEYYVTIRSIVKQREYMIALCCSQTLFANGTVAMIYHGQTQQYYKKVLREQHSGAIAIAALPAPRAPLALELDVEMEEGEDPPQHALADGGDGGGGPDAGEGDNHSSDGSEGERSAHTSDMDRSDDDEEESEESHGAEPAPEAVVGAGDDVADDVGLASVESVELDRAGLGDGADVDAGSAAPAPPPPPLPPPLSPPPIIEPPGPGGPGGDADAAPARPRIRGAAHPESFRWGPEDRGFSFIYSPPEKKPPSGQWQCTCHYHKHTKKTLCTRTMSVLVAGGFQQARDILMLWALQAPLYDRKRHHCALPRQTWDIPPAAIMDARAQVLPLPPLPEDLKTDEELDEFEFGAGDDDDGPSGGDGPGGGLGSGGDEDDRDDRMPSPPPAKRARGCGRGRRGRSDGGARGSGGDAEDVGVAIAAAVARGGGRGRAGAGVGGRGCHFNHIHTLKRKQPI